MRLSHELNDSRTMLDKGSDRTVRGLCLTYGLDGTITDRRRPGWGVLVPDYRYNKLLFSSHCTFRKGNFPGVSGVRAPPPPPPPVPPVSESISEDGSLDDSAPTIELDPDDGSDSGLHTPTPMPTPAAPPSTTQSISKRLPPRSSNTSHRALGYVGANVSDDDLVSVGAALEWVAWGDPGASIDARDAADLRGVYAPTSFRDDDPLPPVDPADFEFTGFTHPDSFPWLSRPWGGNGTATSTSVHVPGFVSLENIPRGNEHDARRLAAMAISECPIQIAEVESIPLACELVLLCDHTCTSPIERVVHRDSLPDVTVSFAWGDVPLSSCMRVENMPYDTGIDQTVFVSMDASDDPTWEQAKRGNERQQWDDARIEELENLERFKVIKEKIPADKVPWDCDIYDTMKVLKRKRGAKNKVLRYKIRVVLCGNQMNASKKCVDLRTQSPTLMCRTYKMGCAAAVCKRARNKKADVQAAYLQGVFKNGVIYARAPVDCREYDERGYELVWVLQRPLYGEPDAGRIWYTTFAHHLIEKEGFVRSHADPCHFSKTFSPTQDIQLDLYVDDISSFDTIADECDAFFERLQKAFAINVVEDDFYLGMDISSPEPAIIKLSNETYIAALVARELPNGADGYPNYSTPGDPRIMEYYESALVLHETPSPAFSTRYRSLVGGLSWCGPTSRPDILFVVGILARAYTFPTAELYGCGVRVLAYLARTASLGITFSGYVSNPHVLVAASDSDWATRRSTSGGGLMLAGGLVHGHSRKQECTAGSSSHAEIIAASTLTADVVHARMSCDDLNIPQLAPTVIDVDNKAVFDVSQDFSATKQLRHLPRRAFRVREYCFSEQISLRLVKTSANWADMFTKVLDPKPFYEFRRVVMGVVDSLSAFIRVLFAVEG